VLAAAGAIDDQYPIRQIKDTKEKFSVYHGLSSKSYDELVHLGKWEKACTNRRSELSGQ
jgi:hypothetical protein